MTVRKKTTKQPGRSKPPSDAKLEEMIEEAIVDAYGESEQTVGFYTMIEDNLATPFKTEMLGVEVTVIRIDITDDDHIVAVAPEARRSKPDPRPALAKSSTRWSGLDRGLSTLGKVGGDLQEASHNRPRQTPRRRPQAGPRIRLLHA